MRAHTRELVRKTLDDLPARLRSVAELYYLRELSLREIGEIMGVTESRVCQLHTRLKERLKELIDVTQLAA
jgi:RNA polymerase sigma factor for flagellar operon FliA